MKMMEDENSNLVPKWLKSLLGEKFFNACLIHEDAKKNEKNILCLDCSHGICPNCLPHHFSHRLLQIRRYVYQDVLRLVDADKLMDCQYIQPYITNSAKVVFINKRQQPRSNRSVSCKSCIICHKLVHEKYLFCSLFCKIHHILRTGDKLSKYVNEFQSMTLAEPVANNGHMTPDTVLEPAGSVKTESGSSNSVVEGIWTLVSTATTTETFKKKRSNMSMVRSVCRPVVGMSNRRKGKPHRAPLY